MSSRKHKTILIFLLFSTLWGCDSATLNDACSVQFPNLQKTYEDAILAMAPWDPRQPVENSRGVASLDGGNHSHPVLQEMDRESWKLWAESRLKEAQTFLDLAQSEPKISSVRKELSTLANDIVAFHGFTDQGNPGRMIATLNRIQEHSRRVYLLACPQ